MARPVLFFDIETVADWDRALWWPDREQKLEGWDKKFEPALCPEFCKVAALGWAIDNGEPQSLVVRSDFLEETTEEEVLQQFWRSVAPGGTLPLLVGFNIFNFDLPVLFVRSALLGVRPTRVIDRRPWGTDCIDLYEKRRYTAGGGGLKDLARWFEFEIPCPGVDGLQVEDLLESDPDKVAEYVKSDVVLTRQLYHLYRGYFFQ